MNLQTLEYIEKYNLTSCMNNTKWKEFISAINSIEGYEPQLNIKYMFEKESNSGFSSVWWEEIEQDGFEIIEWIRIKPFKEEYLGKLVSEQTPKNYSNQIKVALEKSNIYFEFDERIFIVYGYKKSK